MTSTEWWSIRQPLTSWRSYAPTECGLSRWRTTGWVWVCVLCRRCWPLIGSGSGKRKAAFAAPYPGKVIPLDLAQIGGRIIAQKEAFLCAAMGTKLDIAFNKKIGTGLFGGEGFILEDIQGDGLAFVHAGGTIIEKRLAGESLRIDTGCIVAFEPQIDYSIERAGNLKSMMFGGEGIFLATLQGAGHVWLQSLPFNRLADRVVANVQPGGSDGEGSVLGGIGNLFNK